jgi:hypothetical protein
MEIGRDGHAVPAIINTHVTSEVKNSSDGDIHDLSLFFGYFSC